MHGNRRGVARDGDVAAAAIGAVGAAVDAALGLGALALGTASEVVGYAGAFGVAAGVAALGLAVLARIGAAPAS